jgi:hypothetical protein
MRLAGDPRRGEWVYLQNCHLSLSWLLELEAIVSKFSPETAHKDFRLFLSSMPTTGFPVAILRNSTRITNEPRRAPAAAARVDVERGLRVVCEATAVEEAALRTLVLPPRDSKAPYDDRELLAHRACYPTLL